MGWSFSNNDLVKLREVRDGVVKVLHVVKVDVEVQRADVPLCPHGIYLDHACTSCYPEHSTAKKQETST